MQDDPPKSETFIKPPRKMPPLWMTKTWWEKYCCNIPCTKIYLLLQPEEEKKNN